MDVDDDDEYMNAAAAHAAFVVTVSAATMYWLLSCTARARHKYFISSTHFPQKIGLGGSADFLYSGTHPLRCICR